MRLLPVALAVACLGPSIYPQRIRLSAPLARENSGDILDQRVDARGEFVVYVTDPAGTGRARLERAPLVIPGPAVDLGSIHLNQSGIQVPPDFELSPDGLRVVFRSTLLTPAGWYQYGLFSTASDGSGTAVRLDANLPTWPGVQVFRISPDSSWVVYASGEELFAVPIAGGERNKVSGPRLPGRFGPTDLLIGPDSRSVYFRAISVAGSAIDLYRGSVSGRQPVVRINSRHYFGQGVDDFQLSPDGGRLVYRADSLVNDRLELFSAPSDGAAPPTALHPGARLASDVKAFQIAMDGKSVVYKVNATSATVDELYVVPLSGALLPRRLESRNVGSFRLDPLGRRVVYALAPRWPDLPQLLSVALDGSPAAVRIDLDDRPDLVPQNFQISPDGRRVVYHESAFEGPTRLYSSPIDGSVPPMRLAELGAFEVLAGFGADGRRVVFGLTSYLVDGSGPPLFLGGPEFLDSSADGPGWIAGDILLHRRSRSTGELTRTDLYRVPVDRSFAPARVNPELGPGAAVDDVIRFQLATETDRAAYLTRRGEVFGVELDGHPAPTRLDPGDDSEGNPHDILLVSPDGRWVVFNEGVVPFAVPLSGERAPEPLAPKGTPLSITPDSRRLLFLVHSTLSSAELFSVPLDGSSSPVSLSGSPGLVGGIVLTTPDSARTVFLKQQEVYSVPTDGSAPAIDLGAYVETGGYLFSPFPQLQLSLDGRHVVFSGGEAADPERRLLSAPVDGSGPPVTLDPVGDGSIGWFAIDPASQVVVYAHRNQEYMLSLWRVPLVGGAAPVQLLPPSAPSLSGGLYRFALTGDGQWVVFIGEVEVSWNGYFFGYDVFSVPVDGSQQVTRLNDQQAGPGYRPSRFVPLFVGPAGEVVFPEGPDLHSIQASGSGAVVLVHQDAHTVDHVEFASRGPAAVFGLHTAEGGGLYAAPTDGSRPARLSSGPPVPGGDVREFRVTADGSRVVYIGDLDEDGADELFLSFLEQPRPSRAR